MPTRQMPRLVTLLLATALLAGCGPASHVRTIGETEGLYVETGELTYQVQVSRVLNPDDPQDDDLLAGVPGTSEPKSGETWFGIFMRVQNQTESPKQSSSDFVIRDTQENEFRPVNVNPEENPFIYEPASVPAEGMLPVPDSPAFDTPAQGDLILFKLPFSALQNRPLELVIGAAEGEGEAVIDLDV